jgi:hypothetical protein
MWGWLYNGGRDEVFISLAHGSEGLEFCPWRSLGFRRSLVLECAGKKSGALRNVVQVKFRTRPGGSTLLSGHKKSTVGNKHRVFKAMRP